MPKESSVSAKRFHVLALIAHDLLGMKADRIEAARLVMTEGHTQKEVSTQFDVSPQAIWKTVQRLRKVDAIFEQALAREKGK